MPKRRRVTFEDPLEGGEGLDLEPNPPPKRVVPGGGPGSRFSGKPSLDSDEEEDEEEEEEAEGSARLPHGFQGQEEGPEGGGEGPWGEGPVPLTPFNLREELGEGRFDPQGHFLPLPRRDPPDPWLEALEGVPIKPLPPRRSSPPPSPPSPPPLPQLLQGVLELLQPGETVGGALRRLGGLSGGGGRGRGGGGGKSGGRGRVWPRPRPPPELELLTSLADGLVGRGLGGVLEETREGLERRLRGVGEGTEGGGDGSEGEGSNQGGEGSRGEGEGKEGPPPSRPSPTIDIFAPEEEGGEKKEEEKKEEVLWEYTWGEGPEDPLYGPFSSAQMQLWASQGYFAGGGRCRRVGPRGGGPFYDCGRIDFDLWD